MTYPNHAEQVRANYRRQGTRTERLQIISYLDDLCQLTDNQEQIMLMRQIIEQLKLDVHWNGGIGVRLA